MKVKPAEGRAVRDPVSMTLLPDDGREVPDNVFWRRRLRDADVVEVVEAPPEQQAHRRSAAHETREA